jgi:hypothetical protein
MMPLWAGLLSLGATLAVLGGWFNYSASKASPELKERFAQPVDEALQPAPDTPERLKPFGDIDVRGRLISVGVSVAAAKMGPFLWRIGVTFAAIALVGLIASQLAR